MYNRACRILESEPTVRQAPHQRTTPNRLSIHQVVSRWRCLILKVSLIFETIAQRSKVKMLLGQEVYNVWFSPVVQENISRACPASFRAKLWATAFPGEKGKWTYRKPTWIQPCANTQRTA